MHVTESLPVKLHLGQIDQDVRTSGAILDLSSVLFTLNQLRGAFETPRSDNSEHMSSMQLDERQCRVFKVIKHAAKSIRSMGLEDSTEMSTLENIGLGTKATECIKLIDDII